MHDIFDIVHGNLKTGSVFTEYLLYVDKKDAIIELESKKVGKCEMISGGGNMIAELRSKSQITIPKEIITNFSLNTGDKLDIIEKDGMICMIPVEVYPKAYIEGLKAEIEDVKNKIAKGEQPVFDNVDDLISKLEED